MERWLENCPDFRPEIILFRGSSSCYAFDIKKMQVALKSDWMIVYSWVTGNQVAQAFVILTNCLHIYREWGWGCRLKGLS